MAIKRLQTSSLFEGSLSGDAYLIRIYRRHADGEPAFGVVMDPIRRSEATFETTEELLTLLRHRDASKEA